MCCRARAARPPLQPSGQAPHGGRGGWRIRHQHNNNRSKSTYSAVGSARIYDHLWESFAFIATPATAVSAAAAARWAIWCSRVAASTTPTTTITTKTPIATAAAASTIIVATIAADADILCLLTAAAAAAAAEAEVVTLRWGPGQVQALRAAALSRRPLPPWPFWPVRPPWPTWATVSADHWDGRSGLMRSGARHGLPRPPATPSRATNWNALHNNNNRYYYYYFYDTKITQTTSRATLPLSTAALSKAVRSSIQNFYFKAAGYGYASDGPTPKQKPTVS